MSGINPQRNCLSRHPDGWLTGRISVQRLTLLMRPSLGTVETSEAQSSTLLQPPFITDSVGLKREQSEAYDTP